MKNADIRLISIIESKHHPLVHLRIKMKLITRLQKNSLSLCDLSSPEGSSENWMLPNFNTIFINLDYPVLKDTDATFEKGEHYGCDTDFSHCRKCFQLT